ncbi:hypothetical protein NP233_g2094 [Leucocoprinus birnbaumii]|uniref:Phytocyanin domain-containing protein n=1 Tax=Leucocoprinus birnbaumii TaxID=56174 RepID=A0AAD5W1Z9_9AGAR|nr:hypothetical protein NP233_g2094 [Leucocoprinus birnbaumii]
MITSRVLIAALLTGFAQALPHRIRDSAINEPAVSAPNGTPITDGSQPMSTAVDNGSAMSSSSGMDSSMSMDSSSMVMDSSTMMMDSSTMADMSTSVMTDASTSTAAWQSYQTPSYGSGSSSWGSSSWNGGSNYNDCVSQCLAQYGNAPQPWTPPPSSTYDSGSSSSSGSGVTHTVIVAPTQGVFRYVPFAVNASVGDTVRFMWGANNHTVTKSNTLEPCNATSDSPFASGIQLKDFVFDQVVNDTNPTFFHCAVPNHCQKGMFGMINPPSNSGAGTSVSLMMSSWTSSNPDISAYAAVTTNMTMNNTVASNWGGNIDVKSFPEWSQPMVAENVLYTRNFLAANPNTIKDDGTVDLGNANGSQLMIPQDIGNALNNANTSPSSAASAPSASSVPASAASSAPSASQSTSGAATTSPKLIVALAAAAASFFLL